MKRIILILLLIIFTVGCTRQTETPVNKETQKESTNDENTQLANPASVYCEQQGGKLEIRTTADGSQTGYCILIDNSECEEWAYYRRECPANKTVEEPQVPEPQTTKRVEVYNPETGKTEIVEGAATNSAGNTIDSKGDELLKIACRDSINDYPNWTKSSTDLIIWEDSDKGFNFRNSPEDLSSKISSPIQSSDTLMDMDFIGSNEISYVKKNANGWSIGVLKLNGLNVPVNTLVYENKDKLDFVDISPINQKQFAVFSTNSGKAYLNILDTEKSSSDNVLEIPSDNTNGQKISVSPKGDYVYLLYDKTIRIFGLSSKTKIDEIDSAESVVWVGDLYLLYSDSNGTFIYDIKNKDKNKLGKVGAVSALSFNPKENGIIAYNSDSKGEVINCQTWTLLNSKKDGKIETLASERTAIIKKDGVIMYWRFKDNDWILTPSHSEMSIYTSVWKRY